MICWKKNVNKKKEIYYGGEKQIEIDNSKETSINKEKSIEENNENINKENKEKSIEENNESINKENNKKSIEEKESQEEKEEYIESKKSYINIYGKEDYSEINIKYLKSLLELGSIRERKKKIIDIIIEKIYIENEKNKNIEEYDENYYKVFIGKWILKRKEEVDKFRLKKTFEYLIKIVKKNNNKFTMNEVFRLFNK